MKKTLAVIAVVALGLTGCSRTNPEPTPTTAPTVEVSPTITSEPSTPAPKPTTDKPAPEQTTEKPSEPKPTVSSTTDAGTPATQFAARWGAKYPDVPEYAILKAANGTCEVTNQYPDWTNSDLAQAALKEVITGFGLSDNDVVEFAQDAQQNYCASVSNPT